MLELESRTISVPNDVVESSYNKEMARKDPIAALALLISTNVYHFERNRAYSQVDDENTLLAWTSRGLWRFLRHARDYEGAYTDIIENALLCLLSAFSLESIIKFRADNGLMTEESIIFRIRAQDARALRPRIEDLSKTMHRFLMNIKTVHKPVVLFVFSILFIIGQSSKETYLDVESLQQQTQAPSSTGKIMNEIDQALETFMLILSLIFQENVVVSQLQTITEQWLHTCMLSINDRQKSLLVS